MKPPAVISLIALFTLLGFITGRSNLGGFTALPGIEETNQSVEVAVNPLFKSQSAVFEGIIISVNKGFLIVESEDGQKGEIGISERLVIYKSQDDFPTASASSDLNTIETGRQVLINIELIGNKYQAVSISYPKTQ